MTHAKQKLETRDAEPEPEPEPPEPTHFGRSRSRSRKKRGGSGSEKGYNYGKVTECFFFFFLFFFFFHSKNTLFHIHNNTNIVKSAPSRLPLLVNGAKPGRFTRTIRDNTTTQCMFLDMTQLSTYNKLINSLTNTAYIFGFVQP